MAGGIDWFRWHHGSVNDQKFPLVARRAGGSVAEVIAVWACLLERASENDGARGTLGQRPDFEAMDCALGLPDGRALAIFEAMQQRELIDEGMRITAWERRQPKREDSTAAERKRAQRSRDTGAASVTAANVTQCHAASQQVTTEERREELSIEPNGSRRQADRSLPICPHDQIVALYHEQLPELPAVRLQSEARQKAMRGFWRWVLTSKKSDGQPRANDADQALTWISAYFERTRGNDFLMGRSSAGRGHEGWRCDFDFLLTERGRKHVIEKTVDA